jgi:hypothetical protein
MDHMIPDKSAFISYHPVTGRRFHMGNNSFAPILGTGLAIISLNGKCILIRDCLHVPALRNPLYSIRAHQRQHRCGFIGMHQLGMYVFFPSFIVKVNTATGCNLSYEPIRQSTTMSSLDYVHPVQTLSSASNTDANPSTPVIVEVYKEEDYYLPTYAAHWPKKPHTLPLPKYDMSLIPPPAYFVNLKDLNCDALIQRLYLIKIRLPPHGNSVTPPAAPPPKDVVAPSRLECMSEDDIVTYLHHPEFCLPPIRPCDTPNLSESKTTCTPEELHHLTGCRQFQNYQHIITTTNGGTLINTGGGVSIIAQYLRNKTQSSPWQTN